VAQAEKRNYFLQQVGACEFEGGKHFADRFGVDFLELLFEDGLVLEDFTVVFVLVVLLELAFGGLGLVHGLVPARGPGVFVVEEFGDKAATEGEFEQFDCTYVLHVVFDRERARDLREQVDRPVVHDCEPQ